MAKDEPVKAKQQRTDNDHHNAGTACVFESSLGNSSAIAGAGPKIARNGDWQGHQGDMLLAAVDITLTGGTLGDVVVTK